MNVELNGYIGEVVNNGNMEVEVTNRSREGLPWQVMSAIPEDMI